MNQENPHLSYSQVSQYLQCPLKYRFAYVDCLEPEFTPAALAFGAAMHSAIGCFLQSTLEASPFRPDQLLDIYQEEWKGCEGPGIRFTHRDSESALAKKAKSLLTLFVENHDPNTEVIAVEERFTVDLTEIVPDHQWEVPVFQGIVDAVLKENGSTVVVDYKTSARKPDSQVNAMQLVAYSVGSIGLGYDPNELDYRFEYLVKTTNPELVPFPVTIIDNDRSRFLKLLTRVDKAIGSSIFYPIPGYLCSSCGFQSRCREW